MNLSHTDAQAPDSAGSSTAVNTGVKTRQGGARNDPEIGDTF